MDDQNANLRLQIGSLRNLPTLSEASVRIVDAVNDPDIDIEKLAAAIALSPALVARLLGLANSAYFGKSRQIDDLHMAIVQILGLDLVKCLTLGVILNVQFDTKACANFDSRYFWMRSLVTAFAAQRLTVELPDFPHPPSTAYTAGLLMYMGVLVLAFLYPDQIHLILQHAQAKKSRVSQGIIETFGQSHFHVAHELFRKWHLSSVYQSVMAGFDRLPDSQVETLLIDLLRVSSWISEWVVEDLKPAEEEVSRVAGCLNVSSETIASIVDELTERKIDFQSLSAAMGG